MACIASGVVPPCAMPTVVHAPAASVVTDTLTHTMPSLADPLPWPAILSLNLNKMVTVWYVL